MTGRAGFSLVETLVATLLAVLACGAALGLVAMDGRLARLRAERAARADALLTTAAVLGGELRGLRPSEDLRGVAGDSVALRAFRGAGIVCGIVADGVLVRWRGLRDPNPDKDSVLAVAPPAPAAPLGASAPAVGTCGLPDAGELLHWQLAAAPPAGALLLVFESGAYSLGSGALRYQRGAEGRQPLTGDWLDPATTLQALDSAGGPTADPTAAWALSARLVGRPLAGGLTRPGSRVRVPFLDRAAPGAGALP
ncbi:MAG TPA: hypothetical protein VFQ38_22160 [Longimicrobiales bacterium]|nr:hypothetical protein [Longimicrobiales bacterium]